MGIRVKRKFKRDVVVPSDANGVRYGNILHRMITYFLSTEYEATYNDMLTSGHGSRNRWSAHWIFAGSVYIFSGLAKHKNASDADITKLKNRIAALANKFPRGHWGNGHEFDAPVNGAWGWSFGATHIVFHSAFGAYLLPEVFSESLMSLMHGMLKGEADGQGEGKWCNQYGGGNATSISVTPPPGYTGTDRPGNVRAVIEWRAASTTRMVFINHGEGYNPNYNVEGNPPEVPEVTMNGGTPTFLDNEERYHALIVNSDGTLRFPMLGCSDRRRLIQKESYGDDLSWRSWPSELACGFFRHSPNRYKWYRYSQENRAQMVTTPEDYDNATVVDGKPYKNWLTPTRGIRYAMYDSNHLYSNHNVSNHPGYNSGTLRTTFAAAAFILLGGGKVPEMYGFNVRQIWRALSVATNIPNLYNQIPAGGALVGGPAAPVRNRIFQIQRRSGVDYGEINWPTDGGRKEIERRGNYHTYAGLATLVKLFTDESNAQTFEDAFLNSVETSMRSNGSYLPAPYTSDGTNPNNTLANGVRDVGISYLVYWMNERKPFEKLADQTTD